MAKRIADTRLQQVTGGRSVAEQTEWVEKYGSHATVVILRDSLLRALGIPKPKEPAKNLVVLGCYFPFSHPFPLRDSFRLLDMLGVDYTYLDREVCCGAPMIMVSKGEEQKRAFDNARRFMQTNTDRARAKGAGSLAYCCVGCSHLSRGLLTGDTRHMYILDLILDNLGNGPLRVKPSVMGYFEGCHSRYRPLFSPEVRLNWEKYRRVLDRIEGLKVIDLPNNICCNKAPEKIIENAERLNLDTILCPCNGCFGTLTRAGHKRLQTKYYADLLLEATVRQA